MLTKFAPEVPSLPLVTHRRYCIISAIIRSMLIQADLGFKLGGGYYRAFSAFQPSPPLPLFLAVGPTCVLLLYTFWFWFLFWYGNKDWYDMICSGGFVWNQLPRAGIITRSNDTITAPAYTLVQWWRHFVTLSYPQTNQPEHESDDRTGDTVTSVYVLPMRKIWHFSGKFDQQQRGCGIPYGRLGISLRDKACFHRDSVNCAS